MKNVNFLPWRQKLQESKQKKIKNKVIAIILLIICISFGYHLYLKSTLEDQKKLNEKLKNQLIKLERKTRTLSDLENNNNRVNQLLIEINKFKKKILQDELLFAGISRLTPKNVILTDFSLKDYDYISLIGTTKSMQSIAEMMQNFSLTKHFNKEVLKEILNNNSDHIFKIESQLT